MLKGKSIKSDLNAYSNEKIINSSFNYKKEDDMWSASEKKRKRGSYFGNYVTWYENWA